MKPAILVAALWASSASAQIIQCTPAHQWEWVPSWGSMSVWSENTQTHPNGAYFGAHYFFWHSKQRLGYFDRSRGTTRLDGLSGRILFGYPPLADSVFELKTVFHNTMPGFMYSRIPAGPIVTTITGAYLKSGQDGAARWAAIGTWSPYWLQERKVYHTLMPMVGSSDYWFAPARSPVSVSVHIGKKYPADANAHNYVRPCGSYDIVPETAMWVAPFECKKYSYEYHLDPLLPEGTLGVADPNPRNIVEKRIPGATRFGPGGLGGKPRRMDEPSRDFFIPDLIERPGQNASGSSWGNC